MLCTSLDKNYLLWGKLYLLSVAKNAPDEKSYISAVNLTTDEVEMLKLCNPNVTVKNHIIEVPKTIRYRQYMQCRISHVLLEVYNEYEGSNELLIATDADMLIRKPMDELREMAKSNHILLKIDNEHINMGEVQNGIIAFKPNNQDVLDFLKFYNQMWDGEIKYRDDQRQLFKAVQKFKKVLCFGNIPHDYVDGTFGKDSHIWSAHVRDRHYNYNVFRKELGLPEEKICPNPSWIGQSDGRTEAI
jgi:hypothetical protein